MATIYDNIFLRASKMYCKSCLDVFRRSNRGLHSKEVFHHQWTAEAVCKSYRQGCDICGRLWGQLMDHPDRPFGCKQWYRLSTVYVLDHNLDQVKRRPGRDSTDPYTEELYWSGLGYSLEFSWESLGQPRSDPPPVKFHLLAAQSKDPTRLQATL